MDLVEAFDAFPEVAKPIIIKSECLRVGVKFSESAKRGIAARNDILYKGLDNFSYSRDGAKLWDEKVPLQMYLEDGTVDGTCIQIRPYSESPYVIDLRNGDFELFFHHETLGKVCFQTVPEYYRRTVNGVPVASLVRASGDKLIGFPIKSCEYFNRDQQCLYCDLVPFTMAQKKGGQTVVAVQKGEQAAMALDIALHERKFRHCLISGGAIITRLQGKTESEWYADFLQSLADKIRVWIPAAVQVGAQDDEGWKRIHDTGIPMVQPNIEVWDKELFQIICPGKAKNIGYDEWIRRTIRAVDFWGPGNVNPNFVCGVEMAQPFGFKDVDKAVASTLSGYDFLMGNGVLPRMGDFWSISPTSKLAGAEPPPLEFYIKIGKGYLELREEHGFVTPASFSCRYCTHHGTEYDFEYWHGTGPSSRKAEQQDPGVAKM